jgi:urea transport system substrate-binding protein
MLFYPVQYEGEESQRNVFYTGASPNQQAIPAVDYLMNENEGVERWVLAGTDYVYPQHHQQDPRSLPEGQGREAEDIMINYTPFGHSDWQTIVSDIKKFGSAGKKTAVVSTINGDANVPFYQANSATRASRRRTSRSSPSRSARKSWPASTPPRSSATSPRGTTSCRSTRRRTPSSSRPGRPSSANEKRVTNDPMEAHYIGFNMWAAGGREGRHHRRRRVHRRHRSASRCRT